MSSVLLITRPTSRVFVCTASVLVHSGILCGSVLPLALRTNAPAAHVDAWHRYGSQHESVRRPAALMTLSGSYSLSGHARCLNCCSDDSQHYSSSPYCHSLTHALTHTRTHASLLTSRDAEDIDSLRLFSFLPFMFRDQQILSSAPLRTLFMYLGSGGLCASNTTQCSVFFAISRGVLFLISVCGHV